MRYLTADRILTMSDSRTKGIVLVVETDGSLVDIVSEDQTNPSNIERLKGWLIPGFINAHCHLELSHLKGRIPERTGLSQFIRLVQENRTESEAARRDAMRGAQEEMERNGIVMVGDICNGPSSFELKMSSNIAYYNFMELFGFDPEKAEERFQFGEALLEEWFSLDPRNRGSVVPHAPYSVSRDLFKLIGANCYVDGSIISMHNQETSDENEFYLTGQGALRTVLSSLGVPLDNWKGTGFRSTASVLHEFQRCSDLLLVHNTFSEEQDVQWIQRFTDRSWWCTCPNANLYIEGRLPDYDLWRKEKLRVVVGTDSLASNHQLSILSELESIKLHFPKIPWDELLSWATFNGAELFRRKDLGRFQPGNRPGINLIKGLEDSGPLSLEVIA
jgi:cytosine/adenosine deaminase-related metal-dependent hydrolase